MENKMKKLIALFAVSTVASTSAVAGIALSGSASVSYDDNGTMTSATKYDADLSIVGTTGTTTVTIGMDVDGGGTNDGSTNNDVTVTGVDMSTKIGPVTIAADMFDEISKATTTSSAGQEFETVDTGVTVSLDVPVGDMTVGLDNSGDVSLSGTFSGVTVSHTVGDTTKTTASAAIAGIDMSVTNKAGATTWDIATTVSGIDLTLTSGQKVTAAFGIAGNTMTVSAIPSVATAAASAGTVSGTGTNGYGTYKQVAIKSYSTVAIARDLTSGASLSATYSTKDDSLTLKASVAF
jgi:hypothetical protein